MKLCQLKLLYLHHNSTLPKIILLPILSLFCLFNLSAQKESNIKLKIETGFLWDWVEGKVYFSGPFLYVEPKLRTSKHTFLGLRIGVAQNSQRILTSDPNQFYIDNVFDNGNGMFPFVPTFDYYFTKNDYRPYLGVGIGYYFLTTSKKVFTSKNLLDELEVSVNNQVGFLLRGGFNLYKFMVAGADLGKFALGFEFNYIPKADIETFDGQITGTIDSSNIALSIGYTFGNGKSSK